MLAAMARVLAAHWSTCLESRSIFMDYEEEQQMEIEALEAIVGEDALQEYDGMVPSGWSSERPIRKLKLLPDVEERETELSFEMLFQHTDTYPEELPNLKVSNPRGLNSAEEAELLKVMTGAAEENVGMASIFAVMQAAKDWLDAKAGLADAVDPAVLAKQQAEAEERAREAQRAQGTPVTEESFAKWKAAFLEEMAEREGHDGTAEDAARVTGKQWFLEKDVGGDNGEVEALEEELAELDVEDEAENVDDDDAAAFLSDDDDDDEDFLDEYLADAEAA